MVGLERVRTAEAAHITGLDRRTLQEKAAAGMIPGARKVFGRWTFDVDQLRALGTEPSGRISRQSFEGRIKRADAAAIRQDYERVLTQTRRRL